MLRNSGDCTSHDAKKGFGGFTEFASVSDFGILDSGWRVVGIYGYGWFSAKVRAIDMVWI